ncbi:MAG: type pilus biosis protein [Rariglobus sp.]|jgi:type IV pilus assembly protein PilA|nr:type pilus biosis protein [Rariglobus sp.]
MQYYIGSGGVQSGPFSEAIIREKLARGELPSNALCWAEGWPEWRPIASVFPVNTPTPPALPPSFSRSPDATFAPPASTPPATSGLAITSFILGISGFLIFITAIPAVICGHIACSNIKHSNGGQKGRGLAISGLVLGYLIIAVFPIGLMAAMAIPAFQKVRTLSQEKAIINNLRQLDAAAEQWMLEKGIKHASYTDLVGSGPDHYIRTLTPVAGEDYTDLVIRDTDREITVTTAAGRVITHPRFYTTTQPSFAPEAAR